MIRGVTPLSILALLLIVASACTPETPPTTPGPSTFEERVDAASSTPIWVARDPMGGVAALSARIRVPSSVPADPVSRADWFLDEYGSEIGVEDAITELEVTGTVEAEPGSAEDGDAIVSYRRQSNGVPVFAGEIKVEVDGAGEITSLVSQVPADVDSVDTTPTVDEATARTLAIEGMDRARIGEVELMIFNEGMFRGVETPSILAWRVGTTQMHIPSAVTRFVNAHDGTVLGFAFNRVYTERNRLTYDAANSDDIEALMMSSTLVINEAGPIMGQDPSSDAIFAHTTAGAVWSYFFNTHQRQSHDGNGADMVTYTQYDSAPCHTDGRSPGCNAFWYEGAMWFMDGMISDDVFGHEYTHGVVDGSAGLIYEGESGAMNESMADVFGQFFDNGDWEIGEDTPYGALRSMSDPASGLDPQPRHVMTAFTVPMGGAYTDDNDWGGVHTNSGIPNHAAYLMNAGGTHADTGITVAGIGQAKTEKLMYRALTWYMTSGSTFEYARNSLRLAAHKFASEELHGFTYRDCGAVINAYAAVGVGRSDTDLDCFDDDRDNCPMVYNPDQGEEEGATCAMPLCGVELEICEAETDCCEGMSCVVGYCADCTGKLGLTEVCDPTAGDECCGVLTCSLRSGGGGMTCCARQTEPCGSDAECCGEMACGSGGLCLCRVSGETCQSGRECCGGSVCDGGTCS